jgi:hypothetical protein
MKVLYTSPVFKDVNGAYRQYMVPVEALSTYAKRDGALIQMSALGGLHAEPSPQFMAHRKVMMSAKRKIEREGWFCQPVAV